MSSCRSPPSPPASIHPDVQTLTDILIDELHSHIYLKTYYSDSRWQAYIPGQQKCMCIRKAKLTLSA